MKTLSVALGERAYPIHIGSGLLVQLATDFIDFPNRHAVIVTNPTVARYHLAAVQNALQKNNITTQTIIVTDGEQHKNWQSLYSIHSQLLEMKAERASTLIALGGGMIGDLAGFAAATYQRGMPLVQIPTTLLAQVDSSVGGKTAVNHPLGKNMIGVFYQPKAVVIDIDTLLTLPQRELIAGFAEVIKYGLIRDTAFLQWLDVHAEQLLAREQQALIYAIEQSCRNKAEVVESDERESGQRMLLNFGHTFAHAIEAAAGYGTWLHGEAVAVGMVMAAKLSVSLGLLPPTADEFIVALLKRFKLPTTIRDLDLSLYLDLIKRDKKTHNQQTRFVLLRELGAATVRNDVPEAIVRKIFTEIINE